MQNDEVMLQCPNDLCKVSNPETDKYCKRCGTTLIKRYLWAVGDLIETYPLGELVAQRYLQTSHRIFLDTKPGLLPQAPDEYILNEIKPYLRLVTYRLQVPSAYGLLSLKSDRTHSPILLLEQAPIYTDIVPQEGQLMPQLLLSWKEASALRQLNWLLQIAQLWQPLSSEGVASSLLMPELLRVDRSLVRLLQLHPDEDNQPNLAQLGQFWSQLVIGARPSIKLFIEELSLALQQQEVKSAEQLVACLDRGLAEVGFAEPKIAISTSTDTGPSRQRNEDACYPASGSFLCKPPESKAIAIVCDGIGGHEGGNVASNLAIATLLPEIEQLNLDDPAIDSVNLSTALERFACVANDRISQQNDKENRQGRQRMGTTLVMAVGHRHEIYITHVGDSRAYLITRTGCYQVTLDDDVAAREVRLGYTTYRDALQQPSAGSLVQAIGMSPSVHPTIGRFVVDEDCVFLLCSDGLSDFDLVEQCWETEILPILDGFDVATATEQLIEIGNTRNGHDNITVALVHCQVNTDEPETPLSYSIGVETPTPATVLQSKEPSLPDDSLRDTHLLASKHKPRPSVKILGIGLLSLLISIGGGLVYLAKQGKLPNGVGDFNSLNQKRSPQVSATDTLPQKGSMFVANKKIELNQMNNDYPAIAPDSDPQPFSGITGILPKGSVVELLDQKQFPKQGIWQKLRVVDVCSSSNSVLTNSTAPKSAADDSAPKTQAKLAPKTAKSIPTGKRLLQQGDLGWIQAANIKQHLLPIASVSADQMENCSQLTRKEGDTPSSE